MLLYQLEHPQIENMKPAHIDTKIHPILFLHLLHSSLHTSPPDLIKCISIVSCDATVSSWKHLRTALSTIVTPFSMALTADIAMAQACSPHKVEQLYAKCYGENSKRETISETIISRYNLGWDKVLTLCRASHPPTQITIAQWPQSRQNKWASLTDSVGCVS